MNKLPSREVRAARWIDFADFMESLTEEKFDHRNWCRPDHTCKTNACVAGWGAIRYTEQAKKWLDLTFEKQKLQLAYQNDQIRYEAYCDKRCELVKEINEVSPENSQYYKGTKSWVQLGKKSLYITHRTSEVLFYPSHDFWNGIPGYATSKDIALIFRYMATFHGRLGRRFNRERMQKVVDQYNKKEI